MIALLVMAILIRGTKFSSRVNQVVVAINFTVIVAVIVVGMPTSTPRTGPLHPRSQPVPEAGAASSGPR